MDYRIIQLTNSNGEHTGLYMTERTDIENFQSDFDEAILEFYDQDEADEWLKEHKEIIRVWVAEEVTADFN
jgi:hypothetical protein